MKQFSCGAVVPQCHAVFRAQDVDGILQQVAEHARVDHDINTVSPELAAAVREQIITLPA
jgi:predicted small metal-binding protein